MGVLDGLAFRHEVSVTRAPLRAPFSPGQHEVVGWIVEGYDFREVARRLGISESAVVDRARKAGAKIPGDLPDLRCKILAWSRGATLNVLGGEK